MYFASKFRKVLDDFCGTSGNKLNEGKCHFYGWNISNSGLSSISRCMGFAGFSSWNSFIYLPIFQRRHSSEDWLPMVEKFKKKIQSWGFSWLNLAGKIVLIKYVLSSLPIFQFSAMLAPSSILKKMEEWI